MHEGAWQALIRANLEKGDRAAARLTFERCSSTLSHAGLVPSRELDALVGDAPHAQQIAPFGAIHRGGGKGIRLCVLRPRALDDNGLAGLLPGLAEEVTTAVARFRWISCVEGSSCTKPTNGTQHELDVDYLLDSTAAVAPGNARALMSACSIFVPAATWSGLVALTGKWTMCWRCKERSLRRRQLRSILNYCFAKANAASPMRPD